MCYAVQPTWCSLPWQKSVCVCLFWVHVGTHLCLPSEPRASVAPTPPSTALKPVHHINWCVCVCVCSLSVSSSAIIRTGMSVWMEDWSMPWWWRSMVMPAGRSPVAWFWNRLGSGTRWFWNRLGSGTGSVLGPGGSGTGSVLRPSGSGTEWFWNSVGSGTGSVLKQRWFWDRVVLERGWFWDRVCSGIGFGLASCPPVIMLPHCIW